MAKKKLSLYCQRGDSTRLESLKQFMLFLCVCLKMNFCFFFSQLRSEEQAEAKKEQGNAFYKEKKYSEAVALYSEAISKCL